jgi:hypothetical protein
MVEPPILPSDEITSHGGAHHVGEVGEMDVVVVPGLEQIAQAERAEGAGRRKLPELTREGSWDGIAGG